MRQPRKIVIVPDSFKGGLTSKAFCRIAEEAVHSVFPEALVDALPVADGGEGTVDAFLAAAGGDRIKVTVKGPFFEETESFYGRLPDGTAVVETAACAGLPLVRGRENPLAATTYGVGQLICRAVEDGCGRIVLALGGSATNDAGCGMAAALGVRFYDGSGGQFVPTGGTLCDIARIDGSGLTPVVPVTAMGRRGQPPVRGGGRGLCFRAPEGRGRKSRPAPGRGPSALRAARRAGPVRRRVNAEGRRRGGRPGGRSRLLSKRRFKAGD